MGALKEERPKPWPEVSFETGEIMARGEAEFGVAICYTGTGVTIAANKVPGVRAALWVDAQTARGARLWNDANVLALSARLTTSEVAKEIIEAWLSVNEPDPSEVENIRGVREYESRIFQKPELSENSYKSSAAPVKYYGTPGEGRAQLWPHLRCRDDNGLNGRAPLWHSLPVSCDRGHPDNSGR